jgi:cytochrome c553
MEANRMFLRATAIFLVLAFSATAAAAPNGNAAAGKKKAGTCAACHGDGNKTLNDTYPKLAGQYPEYLSKAMHEYKSGKRKNAIMGAQVQALTEQDIADLSAYFASLKPDIHDLSGHAR